jgi:hypothetical protein
MDRLASFFAHWLVRIRIIGSLTAMFNLRTGHLVRRYALQIIVSMIPSRLAIAAAWPSYRPLVYRILDH